MSRISLKNKSRIILYKDPDPTYLGISDLESLGKWELE